MTLGIAGPRVPSLVQHVERLDQVLYDFPDLVLVMRHGAEPWTELAVKLMLKWPNLYYSTSGFAPRYYPTPIVDYANTRGPQDLLRRLLSDGAHAREDLHRNGRRPVQEDVWPEFLGANAARVLKLRVRRENRDAQPSEFDVLASDLGFPEGPVILDDDTFLAVDMERGRSLGSPMAGCRLSPLLAEVRTVWLWRIRRRWSWQTMAGSCGRRSTATASRSTTPPTPMSPRDSPAAGSRISISLRRDHSVVRRVSKVGLCGP